jgi:L,D-transpeptidase YcbB
MVLLVMVVSIRQTLLLVLVLVFSLVGGGCMEQTTQQPPTTGATEAGTQGNGQATSQPLGPGVDAAAVSARLHAIAAAGKLVDLRWPKFSDYRLHFQHLYDLSNFAPVWLRGGQPSSQALGMIQALEDSQRKGLNPEEYDASRWQARVAALKASSVSANTVADFDAALSVDAMRYISALHIGRVNPAHFKFGIDIKRKIRSSSVCNDQSNQRTGRDGSAGGRGASL